MPSESLDWTTPQARVKWLVEQLHSGNRSKFAEAIGVSHTAVSQVVAGQPPGRKFLEAVARNLMVSPEWLLTGAGQPTVGSAGRANAYIPMARMLLPGPVAEHQDLLRGQVGPTLEYAPSQYWYRLGQDEPLLSEARRGFLRGDLLLMETDRRHFPRKHSLFDQLCAVRIGGMTKLAAVTYERPSEDSKGGLLADTFDLDAGQPLVVEETYRTFPDGRIDKTTRRFYLSPEENPSAPRPDLLPDSLRVAFKDLVAVWTRVLHRP